MSSTKVAITGGAGFIGSYLVRRMVEAGHAVRVLELPGRSVDHLPTDRCVICRGDVSEPADVRRFVRGAGWVVNLAANPNLWAADAEEFDRVNHLGARHVIDAAVEAGATRIVHVSTEAILAQREPVMITESTEPKLEDMIGPYCRSKWRAERAAFEAADGGAPVMVASPSVPVGPGDWLQGPMTRLMIDFAHGRIRALLDADLPLIDVRDAAEGIAAALGRGEVGRRYLLAAENWTTAGLFQTLGRLTGQPAPTMSVPYPLALGFAGAEQWFCGLTGRTPMASVTGVKLTRRHSRFDTKRTQEAIGVRFAPVRPAIEEAIDWLAARGEIPPPPGRRAVSYAS